MNKRYQLIIRDVSRDDIYSVDNISIQLMDNLHYLTLIDAVAPKEVQSEMEHMFMLQYGEHLNIIRQQQEPSMSQTF